MANITLSGTLLDPNSGFAARDKIRFTHKTTTGSTLKGSVSTLVIGADGAYSIDLQYGLVLVERRDSTKSQYINLGVVTVNADNPATTLPELLSASVPVSSEQLIEFQSILADCLAAQAAAEAAAAEAAQLGTNTGASLVGTSSGATVQQSLDALTAGQTGGVIVFATYALLDAYTPQNATEEKSSFKVTNDSNTALNGYYSWVSGTAYTKDADLANGVIESGNVDAVSGDTIFSTYGIVNGNSNLYNKNTMNTPDIRINNIGVVGGSAGSVLARIPVNPQTEYSFLHNDDVYSSVQVGALAYYDENDTQISYVNMTTLPNAGGLGGKTLTTPVGCVSIWKNVVINTHNYVNDFQIEEGNETTASQPYLSEISEISSMKVQDSIARDKVNNPTGVVSENNTGLLNGGGVYNSYGFSRGGKNYFDKDTMGTLDEGIILTGVVGVHSGWVLARIPVDAQTEYSFLHNDDIYYAGSVGALAYYDKNNVKISHIDMATLPDAGGLGGKTLTTPAGCAFIWKNVVVQEKDYLNDFQLEEGASTTVYAPFVKDVSSHAGLKVQDNVARELLKNATPASRWFNKDFYYFGDSITNGGYIEYVTTINQMIGTNFASSGATARRLVDIMTPVVREGGTYNLPDYTLASAISIMIGTNGSVTGTIADITGITQTCYDVPYTEGIAYNTIEEHLERYENTYYGNLGLVLDYVQFISPKTVIFLISPPYFANVPSKNEDIHIAMKEIAKEFSIPFIENGYENGISPRTFVNVFSSDGLHLNSLGNEVMGTHIGFKIKNH